MRLFEAILNANQRALAGDTQAGIRPADFADELPMVALTCIDPRLNSLFPEVLGLPREQFIWLRNAGNIITGTMSSTMRSLALACAIKGGREIAVIGHNDCQVCKTSTLKLTDGFRALGVNRAQLPENLTEFFGLFASERQNVMKAAEFIRHSPLIGPRVPVHGLLVDIETGRLEWVVNGYQTLDTVVTAMKNETGAFSSEAADPMKSFASFNIGEMKFPDAKICDAGTDAKAPYHISPMPSATPVPPAPAAAIPVLSKIPLPPPIRPSQVPPKVRRH
jgi:carbonic anhydrase